MAQEIDLERIKRKLVVVQLPDTTFVQLEAEVVRNDRSKLQVSCRKASSLSRSILQSHTDGG
jgi:hypothetical protein